MHKQRVLYIGSVWPEPTSSAAGLRTLKIIEYFKLLNFEVIFASSAEYSDFSCDLDIRTEKIKLNDSSFDSFIKELNPQIVIFDRFYTEEQFSWRVIEQCPQAFRILDTIDLHFLRVARQKAFKANKIFSINDLYCEEAKRELACILRSDLSLIISEFEFNLLKEQFKISEDILFYLPITVESINSNITPYKDRKDVVFIGNFIHEPNSDSVMFIKELWLEIRKKIPQINMNIYGAYPTTKIKNLHNPKQGFYVHGRAEDSQKIISDSKILFAPLRFGAGIKGKILESMIYGTPTITTQIGAEGMKGDLAWNGFIEDSSERIIQKILELYSDENLWISSQKNGFEILRQRFLNQDFQEKFLTKIMVINQDIESHRKENFIGTLLSYHSVMSSKYLSKWIQEKNKNNL